MRLARERWPFDAICVGSEDERDVLIVDNRRLSIRSTDLLVHQWGLHEEIPCLTVPAKWRTGGSGNVRAEGMIRNSVMYELVMSQLVIVLGFPGGTGTEGMCRIAREHKTLRTPVARWLPRPPHGPRWVLPT